MKQKGLPSLLENDTYFRLYSQQIGLISIFLGEPTIIFLNYTHTGKTRNEGSVSLNIESSNYMVFTHP